MHMQTHTHTHTGKHAYKHTHTYAPTDAHACIYAQIIIMLHNNNYNVFVKPGTVE